MAGNTDKRAKFSVQSLAFPVTWSKPVPAISLQLQEVFRAYQNAKRN